VSDDIEDDWAMLRRGPGKIERVARQVSKKTMGFLEFIFTWIGHAYDKIGASLGALWTRAFNPDFLLTLGVVALVGGIGACLFQMARSDGSVKYCRMQPYSDVYQVEGHRDWRPDVMLATKLKTREEALAWTKTIGCPVR
jgi:hypothetical protein